MSSASSTPGKRSGAPPETCRHTPVPRGLRLSHRAVWIAAAAFALAGCGSGDKSSSSTRAVVEQPQKPAANVVRNTQTRLEDGVLTSRVVGADWKVARPDAVAPVKQFCNKPLAGGLEPFAQTRAAFRHRFGSAVTQDLWAYAGDGAQRIIDDFKSVISECPSWDATPELGRTVKYTLRPLDVAKLGDDTVGARLHFTNTFGGIEVDHSTIAIMIRRGNVIDLLTETANAGLFMAKSDAEALARRADRRLAAAS
jgi:hypothetical protein